MAPPVTSTPGVIGGKATGVGVLSNQPVRALAGKWDKPSWSTGRVQAAAVHVQQRWLKIGAFYGFAKDAHTKATKTKTDELLSHLTNRIVFNSRGLRAICGDFNQTTVDLPQFALWKAHGFRELQEIANTRWGREITATCHRKTVKDHVWVSSELAALLEEVVVDDTYFADHSIVFGRFRAFGDFETVPVWPKPLPLPWDEIEADLHWEGNPPTTIAQVFQSMEEKVHQQLQSQGHPGLISAQRGRCLATKPFRIQVPYTPWKPNRKNDFQIEYLGESFQFAKWCRQLRRLQSYIARLRSQAWTQKHWTHQQQLWQSIRAAPGFPGGFTSVWKQRANKLAGTPDTLPKQSPSLEVAESIYKGFEAEFRSLERTLLKHRRQSARDRRIADPNCVYRDVAKPKALPVQTVVTRNVAQVTDISSDGLTITYQPHVFSQETEISNGEGFLAIASHTTGTITLSCECPVEVGDTLAQECFQGKVEEVFQAFQRLWDPIWNRHSDKQLSDWEPFFQCLQENVPAVPQVMPLDPITETEWRQAVSKKKATTAKGPDGVARSDLQQMPSELVTHLVHLINQIDQGLQPWPKAVLAGHITSIEKNEGASTPQDYRQITVLSLVYRVWSTIRARQCLRWLDRFAPKGLQGNRPAHATSGIWWNLSQLMEAAHYDQNELSGLVTDVCKCYNTLPRAVVYAIGRHCGLPEVFMRSWHMAVAGITRHFIVGGACSFGIQSCTGYPEGDPLSVVSMVLINIAMHHIVEKKAAPTNTISFVDSWESHSSSIQATCATFAALDQFSQMIDIRLDKAKTYGWALTTKDRQELRRQGFQVNLHGKDLGGQLSYSKIKTNYALRARIAKTAPFWGTLARSAAPQAHKLRAIATVAWTRCLHGIASIPLGSDHFTRMRAQAMTAMRWEKSGASSVIQFGLAIHPRFDPEFFALMDTMMLFRKYCSPDLAFPVLTALVLHPPSHVVPGPCGVLLARMNQVGWAWEHNGWIKDHEGLFIHVLDCPIQLLRSRLQHAWSHYVGHMLQTRKEFTGLGMVDAPLSRATKNLFTTEEQGLLRTAMNGTFFIHDAGRVPSKLCPYCGEQDSVGHRLWHCEQLQQYRDQLSDHDWHFCSSNQNALVYMDGWLKTTLMLG